MEAGRIITGLRYNSSRQKLFCELGWESLENRRNKQKLTFFFYIILNGLTPGYNLKNENNTIHPPFSRTSSFYDSFIPFTIRLWNTLPLTITESPSLNIFKNRLKHFYKTLDTFPIIILE
jgi:hypothetical protein